MGAWKSIVFRTLKWLEVVFVAVSALLAALLKADPSTFPGWAAPFKNSVEYIHGITWLVLIIVAVVLVFVRFAKQKISDQWIAPAIREDVLDVLRERAFSDDKKRDPLHHHRVTLFRYTPWCWRRWWYPSGGWLVPIARSCHTTQHVKSVFRVPDEADNAEGIAGMTWTTQNTVVVQDLPDLNAQGAQDDDFLLYARKTKITERMAKEKKPHARSFMGLPVDVHGRHWGVIVIDSRSPDFERSALKRIALSYAYVTKPLQRYLARLS